ncbi:hypothetical protein [Methylobacterium phyllostachyos]|uniref:DUF7241 domain-containing protein n=1 Tax=Methylobacterium phyllostachyos TaxID=582672 RepID=UPI00142F5479|nr:hypothetical protein [Methylobacterium phyllostachyos]
MRRVDWRENGWGIGTQLIDDAGLGATVTCITALGTKVMLAREISHDGSPVTDCDEQA